jgi:hypothetical protein
MQLVLAAANQFAERAELDVHLPITERDITQAKIRERANGWCFLVVDDRHRFNWSFDGDPSAMRGRLEYDDLKYSTVYMDREEFLPSLTNTPSLITTNEALTIAQQCLERLSYQHNSEIRLPPVVAQYTHQTSEEQIPNPVPLYGIRWLSREDEAWAPFIFQIQVSGITKKVTSFNQLTFKDAIIDLKQFATNAPPSSPNSVHTNPVPVEPAPP